jgi:serine/threonine protein kinase
MSPEQAKGKAVDVRSDIFSFGAVLYEMLSGHRAFEGVSSAELLASVLRDEPTSLTELKQNIPSEVRRIVTRCLKKDPAARYASGAELARDLKTCRETLIHDSGTGLSAAPQGPMPSVSSRTSRVWNQPDGFGLRFVSPEHDYV